MPPFDLINIGAIANDGTGDQLRAAFAKVNMLGQAYDALAEDVAEAGTTTAAAAEAAAAAQAAAALARAAVTETLTAAVTIPPWTAVIRVDGSDLCAPADPTNPAHFQRVIGVSAAGGASGAPITIVRLGPQQGSFGAFTPGATLWVGTGGALSASPPAGDWRQSVGTSPAADRIVVTLQPPRRIRSGGPLTLPPITDLLAALTPEIMSAALDRLRDALPPLPADDSLIPPQGGWFSTPTGFVRIPSAS